MQRVGSLSQPRLEHLTPGQRRQHIAGCRTREGLQLVREPMLMRLLCIRLHIAYVRACMAYLQRPLCWRRC